MKKIVMIAGAVVLLIGSGIAGAAEAQSAEKVTSEQTVKKQTTCPVMGGKIDPSIYADANGKRVYFCCNGCPSAFKKDSAKYIAKMESEGITLDKTPAGDQTKRPITHACMKKGGSCK